MHIRTYKQTKTASTDPTGAGVSVKSSRWGRPSAANRSWAPPRLSSTKLLMLLLEPRNWPLSRHDAVTRCTGNMECCRNMITFEPNIPYECANVHAFV